MEPVQQAMLVRIVLAGKETTLSSLKRDETACAFTPVFSVQVGKFSEECLLHFLAVILIVFLRQDSPM